MKQRTAVAVQDLRPGDVLFRDGQRIVSVSMTRAPKKPGRAVEPTCVVTLSTTTHHHLTVEWPAAMVQHIWREAEPPLDMWNGVDLVYKDLLRIAKTSTADAVRTRLSMLKTEAREALIGMALADLDFSVRPGEGAPPAHRIDRGTREGDRMTHIPWRTKRAQHRQRTRDKSFTPKGDPTMHCKRCGKATIATIMSMFNTDDLCGECKDGERYAPGYAAARAAVDAAVRAGDTNFKGVGLSAADRTFLKVRR